jgi:hypothetical protein
LEESRVEESAGMAAALNRDCYCKTVDVARLKAQLNTSLPDSDILQSHPHLFSGTAIYISSAQLEQMSAIIRATERVAAMPVYQQTVLSRAPEIAGFDPGGAGVFMGYDFHLSPQGPKVIEINTNAGGAFLNTALIKAQIACCEEAESLVPALGDSIDTDFVQMFRREWEKHHGNRLLRRITLVDENPTQQYLYPEFVMAKALFEQHGIQMVIAAPESLSWHDEVLWSQGEKVELLYNRLTDFYLTQPAHAAIKAAYLHGSIVMTPNPHVYALFADKGNLTVFSDTELLRSWDVDEVDVRTLSAGFPAACRVTSENNTELWEQRNSLFFKPLTGFGGRAAYRGDKVTRRVWEEIIKADYIAQQRIAPSERGVEVDGVPAALKLDIRAYVYAGEMQLLAARLYQGQTTNFRTSGGGFAPVFVAD